MSTNVVMAIGAHPDDIEIGAGGTIASLTESGFEVVLVDLTNGEPTPHGSVPQRMEEAKQAQEILGVKDRHILDLKNRELEDSIDARKQLAELMRRHKPAILFAQYPLDAHPDHVSSASLATAGRFYSKLTKTDMDYEPFYPGKIFRYYAFHLRVKVEPSFIFDISTTFDKKMAAIKAYESQFITHRQNTQVLEQIETEARYWGKMAGCTYGEPFFCYEHIKVTDPNELFSF